MWSRLLSNQCPPLNFTRRFLILRKPSFRASGPWYFLSVNTYFIYLIYKCICPYAHTLWPMLTCATEYKNPSSYKDWKQYYFSRILTFLRKFEILQLNDSYIYINFLLLFIYGFFFMDITLIYLSIFILFIFVVPSMGYIFYPTKRERND